jgi:hypothetical protein
MTNANVHAGERDASHDTTGRNPCRSVVAQDLNNSPGVTQRTVCLPAPSPENTRALRTPVAPFLPGAPARAMQSPSTARTMHHGKKQYASSLAEDEVYAYQRGKRRRLARNTKLSPHCCTTQESLFCTRSYAHSTQNRLARVLEQMQQGCSRYLGCFQGIYLFIRCSAKPLGRPNCRLSTD